MILFSWLTRPNSRTALDRYYTKMKTPVDPDPAVDRQQLEDAFKVPEASESKKLFPGTNLEFQRPSWIDVVGFIVSFAVCFLVIGLAMALARIGS